MVDRTPFRPSLRTLLTSSVVIAAVLPLLCAGILMVITVTRAMEREIGERNLMITRGLAGEVGRFLQEPLSLLEQVRRMLESQALQDEKQLNTYLDSVLSSYRYFDRVERLDAEGTVRLTAPADPEALGNSRAGQHFFKRALASSDPLWSPAFLSFQTGLPTLTLALPLRSGMIVGYLNLAVLGDMIARVRLPGSGWAAILDVEGTILAHRNPEMVAQRVTLSHEPFFKAARLGREGTQHQTFSSQAELISAVQVPLTGWVVALSQPESEALAPARLMIRIIVAGTALAMGLALAIALLSLHRTLKPLSQLASLTHRIADGDYRLQPPRTSYRELEELSLSFQRMVTAVEQREIERSRSEQHYRGLFEESPIALCDEDYSGVKAWLAALKCRGITDLKGHLDKHPEEISGSSHPIRLVHANRAALELYHAENLSDLLGSLSRIMPPGSTAVFKEELLALVEKGRFEIETQNLTLDGQLLDVMVRATIATGYEESWSKVLVSIHDLTERNRHISERHQLETQLQHAQKMEALGTLAGGIAHDFNNLLMGIQGRTALMLHGLPSDHPHGQHLGEIESYVQSAANLTRQLLGFARGGKYEVKPANINALIEKSSQMFGRTRKQIRMHYDLQPDLRSAAVDINQVEQVLLNLYLNADQAMPHGGTLRLQTVNVELDPIRAVHLDVPCGTYVVIWVSDSGSGIDPQIQDRIFEPFFSTKEKGRGTGLGLASSYGIVRNHGGAIAVSSQKGRGSAFAVYLPASDQPMPAEQPPVAAARTAGCETVLLVDDEPMVLEVGEQLLLRLGYRVLTARGGIAAIDIFRRERQRIDLVILDMIMPEIDGGQVFDTLRGIDPGLRVLLSTGYSIDGQAQQILQRGCRGFLQKPFGLQQLSDKIRTVLDQ